MTAVILEISKSRDGYVTAVGEAFRPGRQQDRKEATHGDPQWQR